MIKNIQIRHFKRWLVVCLVSCTLLLGFNTTEAIAQTSSGSGLNQLCRQINPAAGGAGVVARYGPSDDARQISPSGSNSGDGAATGKAVYLTSSSPEFGRDKKYVRVWFDSIDANYKQGWIPTKLANGNGDTLKMGPASWRAANCAK